MSNSFPASGLSTLIGSTIPIFPAKMQVTVMLKKVSVGVEMHIEQAGVPDNLIPAEACYLGWQKSLKNLARLVQPEINQ